MATLFYLCPICGNVVAKIKDGGVVPHCCGQEMKELHPGTIDASREKHVPVFKKKDDCSAIVKVGSEPHPMTKEHFIEFICMETAHGGQLRYLNVDGHIAKEAKVEFCTCKDPVSSVYAYCNIHGLWELPVNEEKACGKKDTAQCCNFF